ncbi:MMPL family transporter [Streptomyces griseus]|uniref:MMPL family transporter n=1 Tax=Streptomyces griseus TaxID=1911 RepID=UPI000AE8A2F1
MLFAGTTVVIALLGLIAMGQRLMTGVAIGASVTVLVTMIAAVTLLPAFLGFTGHKISRPPCSAPTSRSSRSVSAWPSPCSSTPRSSGWSSFPR